MQTTVATFVWGWTVLLVALARHAKSARSWPNDAKHPDAKHPDANNDADNGGGHGGPRDQRAADTVHAELAPPFFAACAFSFFALWTLCGGWHHAQHACPHAAAYLLISSFRITQLGGLCFIFWVPILYILVPWAVLSYLQVGTSPSQSITEYHALQQLEAAIFGIIGHTYIDHNYEEGNYIGLQTVCDLLYRRP